MTNQTRTLMAMLAIVSLAAAACKPKAPQAQADSETRYPTSDLGISYVATKDGLNMREQPSVTGKKMLTIPNGAQVRKLEEKPGAFRIDNIEGKWTKIYWSGKTGWVFGGFLSTSEPSSSPSESTTRDNSECQTKCEAKYIEEERLCGYLDHGCGRFGNVCDEAEMKSKIEHCLKEAAEGKASCPAKCS